MKICKNCNYSETRFDYPVCMGQKGLYDDLFDRVLEAEDMLWKHRIEANVVIVNRHKYADLAVMCAPDMCVYNPSIFGLRVEAANLPNDIDFIVQHRYGPLPQSTYERLISENKRLREKLEAFSKRAEDLMREVHGYDEDRNSGLTTEPKMED